NAGDFTITLGSGPVTLAPGASQTITVVFVPAAVGVSTATLTITTNASGSPPAVALVGWGYSHVYYAPTELYFGASVGKTSSPKTFLLRNLGNAPLVYSFSLKGADPGSFAPAAGGEGGTLAPGDGRDIGVVFKAVRAGDQNALLSIDSNDKACCFL